MIHNLLKNPLPGMLALGSMSSTATAWPEYDKEDQAYNKLVNIEKRAAVKLGLPYFPYINTQPKPVFPLKPKPIR